MGGARTGRGGPTKGGAKIEGRGPRLEENGGAERLAGKLPGAAKEPVWVARWGERATLRWRECTEERRFGWSRGWGVSRAEGDAEVRNGL